MRDWPGPMVPRLLVSVDRTAGPASAMETAELAVCLAAESRFVVGLDFSGNPTKGCFKDFVPAFERARAGGLRCAVHCGETAGPNENPMFAVGFGADRLGHAVHWPEGQLEPLLRAGTPVEICPTSNLKTLQLSRLEQHPTLGALLQAGHPISINCDDCGVFSNDICAEYALVSRVFGLSVERLGRIGLAALDQGFADDGLKARLRPVFEAKLAELGIQLTDSTDA